MEPTKIDWNKVVSESNGQIIFVPEEFIKTSQEVEDMRADYNKDVAAMAKKEITLNIKNQDNFFAIRQYLDKNGYPDIWTKDIGWNSDALKEGKFIINITEPLARR